MADNNQPDVKNIKTRYAYKTGEVVKMKKPHPCGGDCWEITRTGIDFGLKCLKCGHHVMIPRPKFEKNVKKIMNSE